MRYLCYNFIYEVMRMKIPRFLPENGTIGLIAPSFGANIEPYKTRLVAAIKRFESEGYQIKLFGDVFGYYLGASEDKIKRAKHFMDAYLDKTVDVIWSIGGGELMVEILPFIDFERLKQAKEKLFIGFSDNTNLTMTLLTHLNMLTIYGPNFPTFGMSILDETLVNALNIIKGQPITQRASLFHEPRELEEKEPLAAYSLTEPTKWIGSDESLCIEGRLMGGVMDVLLLHLGTPYDKVNDYIETHKVEGIVWYLESFDMDIFALKRALWQMKEAGWFQHCNGVLFGRHVKPLSFLDLDEYNIYKDILGDKPFIMHMDIGHINPMMTLVNGARVKVIHNQHESKLIQKWV